MNPKNALFLSAALTAFVVAVLFGVVTKVTRTPTQAAAAPAVSSVAVQSNPAAVQEQPADLLITVNQIPLTPDEAAAIAAAAINQQDVYSVETSSYQGVESFKVVFSSGDVVYIGLDKKVLAMTKLEPVVVSVIPTETPGKNRKSIGGVNPQPPARTPEEGEKEHEEEQEKEIEVEH